MRFKLKSECFQLERWVIYWLINKTISWQEALEKQNHRVDHDWDRERIPTELFVQHLLITETETWVYNGCNKKRESYLKPEGEGDWNGNNQFNNEQLSGDTTIDAKKRWDMDNKSATREAQNNR